MLCTITQGYKAVEWEVIWLTQCVSGNFSWEKRCLCITGVSHLLTGKGKAFAVEGLCMYPEDMREYVEEVQVSLSY